MLVTPLSDDLLIYAVARGDRGALAELYERHAGSMLAFVQRMLRTERDAEDVLHDVFVEAWNQAGDFDPARGSVRAWLFVRLRSRCLDRVRAHGERRTMLVAGIEEEPVSADQMTAVDSLRVRAQLAQLRPEQRRVLELSYFDGFSSQEISDALGIPVGTVKSRVKAAMEQLRQALGVDTGSRAGTNEREATP